MIRCLFNFLILICHRVESRTSKATKIDTFVSTTNDSQPLTVVMKYFVLDATGVLDTSVINFKSEFKWTQN